MCGQRYRPSARIASENATTGDSDEFSVDGKKWREDIFPEVTAAHRRGAAARAGAPARRRSAARLRGQPARRRPAAAREAGLAVYDQFGETPAAVDATGTPCSIASRATNPNVS
jgi:hypothetical protein